MKLSSKQRLRATIPAHLRIILLREQNFKCAYCGFPVIPTQVWAADHFIPFSVCRVTEWENLKVACYPCNFYKGRHQFDSLENAQRYICGRRGLFTPQQREMLRKQLEA